MSELICRMVSCVAYVLFVSRGSQDRRRRAVCGRPYIERHITQPPRPNVNSGPIPVLRPETGAERTLFCLPLPWEGADAPFFLAPSLLSGEPNPKTTLGVAASQGITVPMWLAD